MSDGSPDRHITYAWERFWIPPAGTLDLSDAGFLHDPVAHIFSHSELSSLTALHDYRALALLGEPGIGKSCELKREHQRIVALPADDQMMSMLVDLRTVSSEEGFRRRCFDAPQFLAWQASSANLALHLDSFDEAMLRVETLAALLAEALANLPTERLSLRIACRTAVWPADILGRGFKSVWNGSQVGVFELAPLRRVDVLDALAEHNIDADQFMRDLFIAQAVPFAIKPLTLDMLIKIHKRHGTLPSDRTELYRQGCLLLAEEQSASRLAATRRGRLNAGQRLRLAGRIAAGVILGGRGAVWTGPESSCLTEDISVPNLAGAEERGPFAAFTTSDDDVREVIDSGLFTSRGDQRMGPAHKSYGEFLAALYLHEKGVSSPAILQLLKHPVGGLIPQLRVVAAWMASFDPVVRDGLIEIAPWTLLQGDLLKWTASQRELLTRSMLNRAERSQFIEHFFGMFETYSKLAHPGLPEQLRSVIGAPTLKPITRKISLQIAGRCRLTALMPEILAVALDTGDDPDVRAAAVSALETCGDEAAKNRIAGLLRSGVGNDPAGEIKGYALELLWPEHLTTAEVFALLTPSDQAFFGGYANFMFSLPERIPDADLLTALEWATGYIPTANVMGEFREKTLADGIMFRAWKIFEQPALTQAFLAHIDVLLFQHGDLCRGTGRKATEAFEVGLRTDLVRRRMFLLFRLVNPLDLARASSLRRVGLLVRDDFSWLISLSPAGTAPNADLNRDSLCSAVNILFPREDGPLFEELYKAAERWPLLRDQFSWLLDGISLEGPEAASQRSSIQYEQEIAAKYRRPPRVYNDIPGKVLECLCRAEAGDWQGWWELNVFLALSPDGPDVVFDVNLDITQMPGWISAGSDVRTRIVRTAPSYLAQAESQAGSWLGREQFPSGRSDYAALRAFVLLFQEDAAGFRALPTEIWRKWTPVIAGFPRRGVTDGLSAIQEILLHSLERAKEEFVGAVVLILRGEIEQRRSTDEADSLYRSGILRDLEGCWGNDFLKATIFGVLKTPDLTPPEQAEILDVLLGADFPSAVEHITDILADPRQNVLRIVQVILGQNPARWWPAIWQRLSTDDDLAKSVLRYAADRFSFSTHFYANIGEEAIADLYLLMERLFPARDDNERRPGFARPLEAIPYLRDGGPRLLTNMGTHAALLALMRLVAAHPDSEFLAFELSRAESAVAVNTWFPLDPREIFALTDRPGSRLVTSAADLLAILNEVLDQYASELHGAQTPVRDLWDRQGKTKLYQPIDENGFSDSIARYLRQRLSGDGIFANREVEVARHSGAPVGTRTDILVSTMRRSGGGIPIDPIAAVIEVKGCWNPEIPTAIETQLVKDYMVRLQAVVGILLVAWFEQEQWDPEDSRKKRVIKRTADDILNRLKGQALAAPKGFLVDANLMKIAAP